MISLRKLSSPPNNHHLPILPIQLKPVIDLGNKTDLCLTLHEDRLYIPPASVAFITFRGPNLRVAFASAWSKELSVSIALMLYQ